MIPLIKAVNPNILPICITGAALSCWQISSNKVSSTRFNIHLTFNKFVTKIPRSSSLITPADKPVFPIMTIRLIACGTSGAELCAVDLGVNFIRKVTIYSMKHA